MTHAAHVKLSNVILPPQLLQVDESRETTAVVLHTQRLYAWGGGEDEQL